MEQFCETCLYLEDDACRVHQITILGERGLITVESIVIENPTKTFCHFYERKSNFTQR